MTGKLSKSKALIEVHVAVMLFGMAGIFAKLIDLPSTLIISARVLIAALSILLIFAVSRKSFKLKERVQYLYLLFAGFVLAFHWIVFLQSIQLSTVAIGLLTFSTFPIFTAFLEPIFFKEKIQLKDIGLALLTIIGVCLIVPEFNWSNQYTQGVVWGIASGATFSILTILNRSLVSGNSAYLIAFYQNAFAAIILFPVFFDQFDSIKEMDLFKLLLLGTIFTALSHTLFINGLKLIKAKSASIIASLEPVYGIIAAIIILSEVPERLTILGGAIIIIAAIVETIGSGNKSSE